VFINPPLACSLQSHGPWAQHVFFWLFKRGKNPANLRTILRCCGGFRRVLHTFPIPKFAGVPPRRASDKASAPIHQRGSRHITTANCSGASPYPGSIWMALRKAGSAVPAFLSSLSVIPESFESGVFAIQLAPQTAQCIQCFLQFSLLEISIAPHQPAVGVCGITANRLLDMCFRFPQMVSTAFEWC